MNRIQGKRVLITGATSGIGEACAHAFAAQGARLILAARRAQRLDDVANKLRKDHGAEVLLRVVDVRDRGEVLAFGREVEEEDVVPDVLVNNAGLAAGLSSIQDGDFEDWDRMIDTNIKGLLNVTRALLPLMIARGTGHVINVGSIAGHVVYPGGNVYNATKFAVRALSQAINVDLLGTGLRCSSIDPGAVETEFSVVRLHGDTERAAKVYEGFTPLKAEDIAEAVLFAANAPDHVNVQQIIVLPTAQRNPYLVHRKT